MQLIKPSNLVFWRSKSHHITYKMLIPTFIILILTTFFSSNVAMADEEMDSKYSFSIKTIYHVYYGEEKIGIVDNQEVVRDYEEVLISELSKEFNQLDFTLSKEIRMIPERVFNSHTYNQETLANLEEVVNVHAETYEIKVDNQLIGHVSRDEDENDFIKNLILEYVSEEELEQFEERLSNDDFNYESMEIGDSFITDINFSEEIEWNESTAHPDSILSINEIIKKLQQGTLEEEIYTVQSGDVLGLIAEEHDLTMDEIMQINPDIDDGTLLQVGDELNVTVLIPLIDIIVEKAIKKEETIPFETEVKEDSSMWKGTSKTTQEGKDGKKVGQYTVTYQNGRSVSTETLSEEIISEPTNRVVVNGTKTSPSRGTGQLAWPAVGGYISSSQGSRWGRLHKGIDIAGPSRYDILAADNGTIKSAGWENGYGKTIRINHNNGMETVYAHLSSINVYVGQTVGKGQQIGRMGSTGNSTGIHLHLEVYKNGQLQNPLNYVTR